MNILILGRAKTGTTILAKTLQANLEKHRLWFEPRSLAHFFHTGSVRVVTKMIYEHWDTRPHSRLALINNELEMQFDKRIAIVRDPRDELVSRMFYMVRGAILDRDVAPQNIARWINLIRAKEVAPQTISLAGMLAQMGQLLDAHLNLEGGSAHEYLEFVSRNFAGEHIVRYEQFIDGDRQALCDYLGFVLPVHPAHDELIERTLRSGGHGGWQAMFHESDLATYLAHHGPVLAALGYDACALTPSPQLNPLHGSAYVARLAAAAYAEKAARITLAATPSTTLSPAADAVPPAPTFASAS